jgi:hypothetical protein
MLEEWYVSMMASLTHACPRPATPSALSSLRLTTRYSTGSCSGATVATGTVSAGTSPHGKNRRSQHHKSKRQPSEFNGSFRARQISAGSHYQSKGPSSNRSIKNVLPNSPPVVCNIWAITETCTDNQIAAITNGTAIVQNWIVTPPSPPSSGPVHN